MKLYEVIDFDEKSLYRVDIEGANALFQDIISQATSTDEPITSTVASLLIANNEQLFDAVADYTVDPTTLNDQYTINQISKILHRIKPFIPRSSLYRGEPSTSSSIDIAPTRGFKSWSGSPYIALDFAKDYRNGIVKETKGPLQGFEMAEVANWRMRLTDQSSYGSAQSEWLVLDEPKNVNIIDEEDIRKL